MDDFSKYTWFFPLTAKSNALDAFKFFKLKVENQFERKIKCLQSDWRGEFRPFANYLAQFGILFRHPCPHTHHQNGTIERKHRHITETGLILLS